MENTIIKFKNDLKSFQSNRKKLLTAIEKELSLLKNTIDNGINFLKKYTIEEINKNIKFARIFGFDDHILETLVSGKRKEKVLAANKLLNSYQILNDIYNSIKEEHLQTRDIINAFENDKIKDPINNIVTLLSQIKYTNLTDEEISTIIGITISFNSQYAKKHKQHQIEHIDIIHELSKYYNSDGTFKYNEDIELFNRLLNSLENLYYDGAEIIYRILNQKQMNFCNNIITLLKQNNEKLRNLETTSDIQDENIQPTKSNLSPKTIKALQTLRKYYKNGNIIEIPEDLNEFYANLSLCELNEEEQKYIIKLINEKISNNKSNFLNTNEQKIYENATRLLDSFNYNNGDTQVLKQYLEELQTILEMLETETNTQNQQYLLAEIPNIIEQLSIITSKYTKTDYKTTNRFIFLLDKFGIPFIFKDMEEFEQTNKKAICTLMDKINQAYASQFRKVLYHENLLYNMYEVLNRRAHILFVEVDAGIYVIIGANTPQNGYKELNQRLKTNQLTIKKFEELIKDPSTREQILKSNEEYTESLTSQNESKPNKLSLKIHN